MSISPSYLEAAATVATVAPAVSDLDVLVAMSQMTVSQMNALSMSESHHQRIHWLSEQVLTGPAYLSCTFGRLCSWTIRCSRARLRIPSLIAARSGSRSGPVAPPRSLLATSRGSSLLSWPTRSRTSAGYWS